MMQRVFHYDSVDRLKCLTKTKLSENVNRLKKSAMKEQFSRYKLKPNSVTNSFKALNASLRVSNFKFQIVFVNSRRWEDIKKKPPSYNRPQR